MIHLKYKLRRILVSKRGLSFFEVMVAIAILSTTIVFIYKSFFMSLSYQRYLVNRLYAMNLLNNEIANFRLNYSQGDLENIQRRTETIKTNVEGRPMTFNFEMIPQPIDNLDNLEELKVILSWEEDNKKYQMDRTLYFVKSR